jgi:hypothetical protein
MKELLRKKLAAVKSLEERAALKELIETLILPMAEHEEAMWEKLEARVFSEIPAPDEAYEIVTGLCSVEAYDPLHSFLFPILPPEKIDLAQIQTALSGDADVPLFSVYIRAAWREALSIVEGARAFEATLRTQSGSFKGTCRLMPDTRYQDALRDLYKSFGKQDLPWRTVQSAYIDRIARVVLSDAEKIPDGETLTAIHVNFGDFSEHIQYDMLPLWNVKRTVLQGTNFALPMRDELVFEHRISLSDAETAHVYLVTAEEEGVRYVKREASELIVIADTARNRDWSVHVIVRPAESQMDVTPQYPLFSNRRRLRFADRFAAVSNVFTRAEVTRTLSSYALPLAVKKIEVTEERYPVYTHGTMNFALDDAFSQIGSEKSLCVSFAADEACAAYAQDMARFLASELQTRYPAYRCVGILV